MVPNYPWLPLELASEAILTHITVTKFKAFAHRRPTNTQLSTVKNQCSALDER